MKAGISAWQAVWLVTGGLVAVLVAGIGLAVVVTSSFRRAAALWRSWRARRWRRKHRKAGRPNRGEQPLSCLEQARLMALVATLADKDATRQAGAAEREQRERMEASEGA